MGIKASHLRALITKTLSMLPPWYSKEAVELLMLTACNESDCGRFLTQLGPGPALGAFGIEPETLIDIYDRWLAYRHEESVNVSLVTGIHQPDLLALEGNLVYCIAMARICYLRARPPLPPADDPEAMAKYYVKYFNRGGKAKVEVAKRKYELYALPL